MKWGRCGTIRYDGFVYYMEYDPKIYYPDDVKEADAEFVKEQNDYLEERKRIPLRQLLQENIARLQKELEHSKYSDPRRRRIFAAKSTAEDALFFLQYGITIAEAARGKAPKFFHVNCIVQNPLNVVVHGDNVQFEAKTVVDTVVDDVVVVTTEEEIVIEAEVHPNVVEEIVIEAEVVSDFNVADDSAADTVDELVVMDTPYTAPIRPMIDIDIVEDGGILKHEFVDPYLEQVDAYDDLHFYVASQDVIPISLRPCAFSHVSLVKNGVTHYYDNDTKLFIRVNFDPGIFLGFIVEYHGVRLDGADFYDIMLIRGRILSKRERMI